jgi:phage-related protein
VPLIPLDHVLDSHKLVADGRVDLFELTPNDDSGVIMFKPDNDVTWRSNEYTGLPLSLSGEKQSADTGLSMPKMIIGDGTVDLSPFKPLVYDGYLDNAIIVRKTVLLENILSDNLIFQAITYRIKRVDEYSRSHITLQLATSSDSLGFALPYRTYGPPAFRSVQM